MLPRELTNSVNIFIKAVVLNSREIEVDDMHNVSNVKATSRHASGNHDWGLASWKRTTNEILIMARVGYCELTEHPLAHAAYGQSG